MWDLPRTFSTKCNLSTRSVSSSKIYRLIHREKTTEEILRLEDENMVSKEEISLSYPTPHILVVTMQRGYNMLNMSMQRRLSQIFKWLRPRSRNCVVPSSRARESRFCAGADSQGMARDEAPGWQDGRDRRSGIRRRQLG